MMLLQIVCFANERINVSPRYINTSYNSHANEQIKQNFFPRNKQVLATGGAQVRLGRQSIVNSTEPKTIDKVFIWLSHYILMDT
jgi:hypothetical protein